jgi:hypothetical protein
MQGDAAQCEEHGGQQNPLSLTPFLPVQVVAKTNPESAEK